MPRHLPAALGFLFWVIGSVAGFAEIKPAMVERGKRATAFVQVSSSAGNATGSGFCIDKSGLFITNAHVVGKAATKERTVKLVVDIGLETQRSLPATVLRQDDDIDLALVQVGAGTGYTPLDLGRDADLKELAEVTTFGYPLGKTLAVGRGAYPDITIVPSRITSLRKEKGRLRDLEFDNQLNPGNSGGPVLDANGKVVGVAEATVRAAALNRAIPVSRLKEFLATPGLIFEPPPIAYTDRAQPATWTIRVQPPTPVTKLPEKLSVAVTISDGAEEPRTYSARPAGDGVFKATITPVPRDPDQKVGLHAWDGSAFLYEVSVKDDEVRVGAKKFRISELRAIYGGSSPRVETDKGETVTGPVRGLGKVKAKVLQKTAKAKRTNATKVPFYGGLTVGKYETRTVDLARAPKLSVTRYQPPGPIRSIDALIEAKQGSKVLAALRTKTELTVKYAPYTPPVFERRETDDGLITLGGDLHVDGVPRGAGKSIHPPQVPIPAAKLTTGPSASADAPLVRRAEGTISDVAIGGGGRYLLLTLKDSFKLAVFDVNAADIVKVLPLASSNALVAAGAKRFLVAFPDEKLMQCWVFETLQRDGGTRPAPIKRRLCRLVLGSDSAGPALACWMKEDRPGVVYQSMIDYWYSLIDLDSLTALKVASTRSSDMLTVATSRGSFTSKWTFGKAIHIRASAGGALFGIWEGRNHAILAVQGNALVAAEPRGEFERLIPSADGRTLFTDAGARLDADGNPINRVEAKAPPAWPEMIVPSSDPSYYLRISGLSMAIDFPPGKTTVKPPPGPVTVSVHAADGTRLLTVPGLDEMSGTVGNEPWVQGIPDEFTPDKRFHLVPAAKLLITIPPSNDRVVLRRVELDQAPGGTDGDRLVVVSPPTVNATAGGTLEHQVVARSKKGGITYTLSRGPDGLVVTLSGLVTWSVPQQFKGKDVTAVLTIGDQSGEEVFHTLKIRVE